MKPQGMSEVASRQLATVHIAGETANPTVGIEARRMKRKEVEESPRRERRRKKERVSEWEREKREAEVNSRTGLLRIRVITCLRERAVARTEVEHGMAPGVLSRTQHLSSAYESVGVAAPDSWERPRGSIGSTGSRAAVVSRRRNFS